MGEQQRCTRRIHGGGRRRARGRAALAAGVLVALTSTLLPSPTAHAAGNLVVELQVPAGPLYLGAPAEYRVLVSNTGTDPLTDVTPESGVIIVGEFGEPTIVVGDADDVLDPGEQWLYLPTGAWWSSSTAAVTVHATQPDTSVVSVVATIDFATLSAVVGTVTPSALSVTRGEVVRWVAEATNRAPFPVGPNSVEWRVLYPNWVGPISYSEPAAPTGDANANGLLDPGETWRWEIGAPVLVDQSYLDLFASYRTPEFVVFVPWQTATPQPITVLAPVTTPPGTDPVSPTTTVAPTDVLPTTGAESSVALLATATIVAGLVLVAVARRGRAGSPRPVG